MTKITQIAIAAAILTSACSARVDTSAPEADTTPAVAGYESTSFREQFPNLGTKEAQITVWSENAACSVLAESGPAQCAFGADVTLLRPLTLPSGEPCFYGWHAGANCEVQIVE